MLAVLLQMDGWRFEVRDAGEVGYQTQNNRGSHPLPSCLDLDLCAIKEREHRPSARSATHALPLRAATSCFLHHGLRFNMSKFSPGDDPSVHPQ
mmetsp:Transcript_28637/g.78238  ORF Transcript_28637/g.78238 Transcript_28637/m.78238 type:complete len:94 (+) Transcript_28637:82-363(+)